ADRWSTLVKPARPIVGVQMHGITDKDVAKSPSAKDAAQQLLDWAGDATLIGHNVGFDLGFISEALGGKELAQGTYLDTLTLARDGYPTGPESYKLGDLSKFFGIELQGNHRAGPDAEATAELVLKLAADIPGRVATLKAGIADSIRTQRTHKA